MASIRDMLASAKAADPEHRDVPVVLDRSVASQLEAIADRIDALQEERDEKADRFRLRREEIEADKRFSDPRPGELAEEEGKVLGELDAEIDRRTEERQAILAEASITLRFFKIPGEEWARVTADSAPREGVTLDSLYGYNYHDVARIAAAYRDPEERGGFRYGGRLLDDGTIEHLEPEDWEDLWRLLSGGEFERIATQVFDLNDYAPRRRAEAAKKASRVGSAS